jgi:hypothetical protein
MILTRADSGRGSSYSSDDATRRNIAEDADFWGTLSGGVGSRYSGGAAAEHDERSASAPRLGGAVAGVGRVADRLSQALMAAKPPGPPSSRRGPLRTFAAISEEDLTGNEAEASSSEDDVVRAVTKAMHRSGSNKFPHTGLVSAEADDDRALVSEERAQRSATSEPRPSSFTAIPGHANRASLHRSSDSRVPSSRLSDRMHDRAARNRGDALFPAQDDDDHASSNSDSSSSSLNQGKTASRRSSGGSGLRSSLEDARDAVAMLTEALATSETYRSESLDRLARLTPSPGRSSAGPSPSRGGSSGIPSPRVPSPEYWSPDAEARLRREFFWDHSEARSRGSATEPSLGTARGFSYATGDVPKGGTVARPGKASALSSPAATLHSAVAAAGFRAKSVSDVRTPRLPPTVLRASFRAKTEGVTGRDESEPSTPPQASLPQQHRLASPSLARPSLVEISAFEAKLIDLERRMIAADAAEDYATVRECLAEVRRRVPC